MSLKLNLVAAAAAICLLATASENSDAQVFQINNGCTCQPVRVIRPACPVYYTQPQFQAYVPAQSYAAPQFVNQVQPIYSAPMSTSYYGESIVSGGSFNETILSQSLIEVPTSAESTSTISGVFEAPVLLDSFVQPSVSDIPAEAEPTPATAVEPAPAVEPVPDGDATIITPEADPVADPVSEPIDETSLEVESSDSIDTVLEEAEFVPAAEPPVVDTPAAVDTPGVDTPLTETLETPKTEPTPAEDKSILDENL